MDEDNYEGVERGLSTQGGQFHSVTLVSFLIHRLSVLQNSANIIIQNGMTGQLEEEKI